MEPLEERTLLTGPTTNQQYLLELINRMRMDPASERELILNAHDAYVDTALYYFDVNLTTLAQQWANLTPTTPLAWNANLAAAATAHSDLMRQQDQQAHQLAGEADLGTRITNAGYTHWTELGENIFAYAENIFEAHAAFAIDWGNTSTGIQSPPGHRINIMNPSHREVGIGIVDGDPGAQTGPLLITEDFGNRSNMGNPFLLGVVFQDANGDGFYEPGEGLDGVTIQIAGSSQVFTTTSWSAGGYQVQVPAGTYTVTYSGGGLNGPVEFRTVVGSSNVKVDLNTANPSPPQLPATTTTITASTASVLLGQPITFTATVSPDTAGIPTGSVLFFDGATVLGAASIRSVNGRFQASLTTSSLAAGEHSITAVYTGDARFAGSTSTVVSATVRNSKVRVAAAVTPTVFGQPVTFTATVTPLGPGTPTGTVTFFDGGAVLGEGDVQLVNGVYRATLSTPNLEVGGHRITAVYQGDVNFTTASSAAWTQRVRRARTSVAVTSSARPAVFGQAVTFTATLNVSSPGSGIPTGTVTFKDGLKILGTGTVQNESGVCFATFTTTSLAVGSHSITAVYGGDAHFRPRTSLDWTQGVRKAQTQTVLASSADSTTVGEPVTFTAAVTVSAPGGGIPTGTVTFMDGNRVLGTRTLEVVDGVAQTQFTTSTLAVGDHSLTAVFGGSGRYFGSISAPEGHTVAVASAALRVKVSLSLWSGR